MAGPTPLPTVEDLEQLSERVRQDPGGPAYVELAEAYLALGHAREAIEAAQAGLARSGGDHAGRLVLARAFTSLHLWKEAQAELLAIVKVDRGNRAAFALLGEVLMRRGDHERAIPVLQHAHNLDPSSARVLKRLNAARSGQPLEPPPPPPSPVAPARRGQVAAPPTVPPYPAAPVAAAPALRSVPVASAPSLRPPPPPPPAPPAPPAPPSYAAPPPPPPPAPPAAARPYHIEPQHVPDRGDATVPSAPPDLGWAPEPSPHPHPPSSPPPIAMPMPAQAVSLPMRTADGAVVRPRVLPQAKPQNAAAASLRQSAAVGENYLNDLLTGGLLDVPGVRVPDGWDVTPERRWGRSAVKAFVVLFILLAVGAGGGGGYYWWSQKEKAKAVAGHREAARVKLATGSHAGLTAALAELQKALERDESNPRTFAAVAEAHALRALVYGTTEKGVDTAIDGAARALDAGDAGYRELVLARAALALARLDGSESSLAALATAREGLDAHARAHPDDRWARWLQGRALLAAGQRTAAATAFDEAAAGPDGLALAAIDRADLHVDDGRFDQAMKLYDDVLARDKDQVLAIAGKALARAERGTEVPQAMDDLNVALDAELGPRVAAYRQLALALSHHGLQKFVPFTEALARATGPREPRFLARVALAQFLDGKLADAAATLAQVSYHGKGEAEVDPQVALVHGALQVAGGETEAALITLKGLGGTRAALLRGQALYDLRQLDDAARELDGAAAAAPESVEVKVWQQLAAAAVAPPGKARAEATAELERTSRAAASKLGRHAHGVALLQQGDLKGARRRLEQALENVTAEEPHPLAYRTHVALAEIARAEGDDAREREHLDAALAANPGYLPARLARARRYLADGDGSSAAPLAASVVTVPQYATAASFVLLAESHARRDLEGERFDDSGALRPGVTPESLAAERRTAVLEALRRAREAGADAGELSRVAALVDPALAGELGLGAAAVEEPAPPAPTRRRPAPRRRGRGR